MLYKEELSTLSFPLVQILSQTIIPLSREKIYTGTVIDLLATKATLHLHTRMSAKPTINASAS